MKKQNLYFDNAATSFPKPPQVAEAIAHYITNCGGTYSRGGYRRAFEATGMVEECRDIIAQRIGCSDPERVIFTSGATMAANTLLFGLGLKSCKVLVSPLEHNAIMRPLNHLAAKEDIEWSVLPHHSDGSVDLERLDEVSKEGVALIIINHVSNLNGVIQPIAKIKEWAGEIPVAIDASQSAGHHTIDVESWNIDFLIFTGHKGLLGATGSGGLYIKEWELQPLIHGGTSTLSHKMVMPDSMPDALEAGTPPMVAIVGLKAALEAKVEPLHTIEDILTAIESLRQSGKYRVYCANNTDQQSELFAVTHKDISVAELAMQVYDRFGIECRSGMLCAPLAHQHLGTMKEGVVRLSFSPYHTKEDIEYLTDSLLSI